MTGDRNGQNAGGKGGRPGQWSARKAQMAVEEYKREGGGKTRLTLKKHTRLLGTARGGRRMSGERPGLWPRLKCFASASLMLLHTANKGQGLRFIPQY
jgi:hypothetical protein